MDANGTFFTQAKVRWEGWGGWVKEIHSLVRDARDRKQANTYKTIHKKNKESNVSYYPIQCKTT